MRRRSNQAFTLIVLSIFVAIVGILSVLPIHGNPKHLANAKTAEARNTLGQIAKDAATAVQREKGSTTIVAAGSQSTLMRSFSGSAPPVPSTGTAPPGQKYQSQVSDWSGTSTS